ncbi:MAG TPA: hypothetical protein VG605_05045, partial [Puia sp.]|nr:hypothetical protein [Puia sp.]
NSRTMNIVDANIARMDLASPYDSAAAAALRETLECGFASIGRDISLDRVITMLETIPTPHELSWGLDHTPPRIIVWGNRSILVMIDGIPRLKWNKEYGAYVVANSPYTIIASTDGWYYLYGSHHWYIAPSPEGPYHHTTYIAPELQRVTGLIEDVNNQDTEHEDTLREGHGGIVDIIMTLTPAELLQFRGGPVFMPISGTRLLYLSNSNNDIFLDSLRRRYFTVLSGRWFAAKGLTGPWQYIPADSLPGDFWRIPEGSPEDRVLACIPGTAAAREALVEASIPQTALVDRRAATTHVAFDGPPRFAAIRGTHLEYALNTSSEVLKLDKMLYCVDQGVWFCATNGAGPWVPCTHRPAEVSRIPPDYPVYNCKYVYIYSADSNYISTGYTAGYLGSYPDGHTLVYGTGYYSPCYTGNAAFPRPWTYGFNMWYNPWYGWSLGYDFSLDWLNTAMAWGLGYWTGGWWGPAAYRPPYIWHHFSGHGLYEKDIRRAAGSSYNNNIYLLRRDVVSRAVAEHVVTDGTGNVFCPDGRDGWMRRDATGWTAIALNDSITTAFLGRLNRKQQRGTMRVLNFRLANGGAGANGLYLVSNPQTTMYVQAKK